MEALATAWALLRVGCFSVRDACELRSLSYAQVYRRLFVADPPAKPVFDVVMLGLSGAGKSTLLKVLLSEGTEDVTPTNGVAAAREHAVTRMQGS